jgi:hypothetical protein
MALTASRTTKGAEYLRDIDPNEIVWLPGDPGVTFTRGDKVDFTNGVLSVITKGDQPLYVVEKTTVCPAATTYGFPVVGLHTGAEPGSTADIMKCLVPCRPLFRGPIYLETFSGQFDDLVAATTPATPSITLTTSPGANDDTNGAIIYTYAGTGAGQWNIGDDYVHTTKVLTMHRKFESAVSTDTYAIVLEGEGGSVGGIGYGTRLDDGDHNNLVVDDGYNDGENVIYMDALQISKYLKDLMLPVVRASDVYYS